MSFSVQRLGLPICVALAGLLVLLAPQTLPAQSQGGAPFWISCDTPADDAAAICQAAGERIADAQKWEITEKSSLHKLADSELLASAQQGGAKALVIRLKLHRSPGVEKRYAIEIVGVDRAIKRTYGMAKVSQLTDELVRLGDIVLSTASTPPAQAEDSAEDEPDEEPAEAAEPVEEPAEEPVEEPVEETVEEPEDSAEPTEEQEEDAPAAPRTRVDPPQEDDSAPSNDQLADENNPGEEKAVENEQKNVGGIAGACAGGSGGRQGSRQRQSAIPVVLTLLALGQFVRRRAGSSRRS